MMSINLLKRLESSVFSFRLTVERIRALIAETIDTIQSYQSGTKELELQDLACEQDFDDDDRNTDLFTVGRKLKIDLDDMDYLSWAEKASSRTPKVWSYCL